MAALLKTKQGVSSGQPTRAIVSLMFVAVGSSVWFKLFDLF